MALSIYKSLASYPLTVNSNDLSGLHPSTLVIQPGGIFVAESSDPVILNLLSLNVLSSAGAITAGSVPVSDTDAPLGLPTLDGGGLLQTGEFPTVPVSKGGTGATSLTSHGILLGNSTSPVTVSAALTSGQLLIGSTGVAPVPASLTGTASQVVVTPGAGSVTLSTPQSIATTSTPQFAALGLGVVAGGSGLANSGKTSTYNSVATSGWGQPAIYASGRSPAVAATSVASVATYTVGAADGSFMISANVLITTLGSGNFNVTVAYTDEGSTSRTTTLNFSNAAGTIAIACAAAGPFQGVPLRIRAKAATAITVATTGTFTGCTYNVEADIVQVA